MIKIIKKKKIKRYEISYKKECEYCNSIFLYQDEDVINICENKYDIIGTKIVVCPVCGGNNYKFRWDKEIKKKIREKRSK